MQIKQLHPAYAVTPQISVEDIPAIVEAGFGTILCNRPDAEVMPMQQVAAIEAASLAAGLAFVVNPVTHQGLNMEMVDLQRATIDASDKPVLAYCASGTRCTIVWALGQAGTLPVDEILDAATAAGYDLGGMRGQLENIANR